MSFQKLVRSQGPYSNGFIPKDNGDNSAEGYYEQVFSCNFLNEKYKVKSIENRGKYSIKKVSWKHKPSQLDKVSEHADFDFTD